MGTKAKLPSTAVGRRRLLKLATMLIEDARNKKGISFDLRTWGHANKKHPMSCGTFGCAMGLAVASGAFVQAGLKPIPRSGSLEPRIGSLLGFQAAAKLFSITNCEAYFLFDADHYREYSTLVGAKGERTVAMRIRDFVAGRVTP